VPLRIHSELPPGLLDCDARELHARLGGPTLIELSGGSSPGLFVTVLLHGNETSGWDGLRSYLRANPKPPRDLTVFIGNTAAAAQSLRVLPKQPDFNRIWRHCEGPGAELATAVQEAIAHRPFFAAIDLHNNTGHNPHYSVVTDFEPKNLGLAYLFSEKAVFMEEPDTVLVRIFAGLCPAVALEVGPIGDPRCAERVADYVGRCMMLEEVPEASPDVFSLFRTRARVHVRDGVSFRFEGDDHANGSAPLTLTGGVEAVNFHELGRGSQFGTSTLRLEDVLRVLDVQHRDVTNSYFERQGQAIVLRQSVVPAMYTTDPYVIRQDCLCYLMERMTV
jgi:hypothetical protein